MINDTFSILGDGFFKDEIRCDYLVPEKMKYVWATEIDLYLEFEKICKKHKLKYFVIGGTILGAIRHNGFIPWDDDMDVCMPRDDYEKFLEIANNELPSYLFLQTPQTDPGYYYSYAKLRNSNTTSMPIVMSRCTFNQGIFLDVFPLDYIEKDNALEIRTAIYESVMKCSSYMKKECTDLMNEAQLANFYKFQTNNPTIECEKIQSIATNPSKDKSWLSLTVVTSYDALKLVWPAECFADTVLHKYENIEVMLPIGYDTILKTMYGCYMDFPPIEKRGTWHGNVIWDPDKPYSYYLTDERIETI